MAVLEAGRAWERHVAPALGRTARGARQALAPIGLCVGGGTPALGQTGAAAFGGDIVRSLEASGAASISVFVALAVFSTVTAFLYVRERERWTARAGDYDAEIARLRAESDRADVLLSTDPQMIVSWAGSGAEPVIEGDVAAVAGANAARKALAFGAWLPPSDAQRLEGCVASLRDAGESFTINLRSNEGVHLEALGRVAAGRAIMRIRDVGGERRMRIDAEEQREQAERERDAMRGLVNQWPQPVWMRDDARRLSWVNLAYVKAVEAKDADDAIVRNLE
ncbi:MAG: hypothetical protein ABWZ80_08275, partial [Beijerinckiaceae bacterium]